MTSSTFAVSERQSEAEDSDVADVESLAGQEALRRRCVDGSAWERQESLGFTAEKTPNHSSFQPQKQALVSQKQLSAVQFMRMSAEKGDSRQETGPSRATECVLVCSWESRMKNLDKHESQIEGKGDLQ